MSRKRIAEVLKSSRKSANLSVEDVQLRLEGDFQISISSKSLYSYESGHRQPDADTLMALCEIYGIYDIMGAFKEPTDSSPYLEEFTLAQSGNIAFIKKYQLLNEAGKAKVDEYVEDLLNMPKYQAVGADGMTVSERERCEAIGKEMGQLAREVIQSTLQKKGG